MSYAFNPFTGNLDIVNKLSSTNYTGNDCSNPTTDNGNPNRTLTVTGVILIIVDNQLLHPTVDYTLVGTTLTFLNEMWNSQKITIWK